MDEQRNYSDIPDQTSQNISDMQEVFKQDDVLQQIEAKFKNQINLAKEKDAKEPINVESGVYIDSFLRPLDFDKQRLMRDRAKYFKKDKMPVVDLPHGMKNILYLAHKGEEEGDNYLTKKDLSETWH